MFCCDDCGWLDREFAEECEGCGLERCFDCTDLDPYYCNECRAEIEDEETEDESDE